MNQLIQSKIFVTFIVPVMVLACFAPLAMAQAAELPAALPAPPPDGAYKGFNTAEGFNALFSLTTGTWNTAIGASTLKSDTTGSFNTALGGQALLHNTGDANTAVGVNALVSNTTGSQNVAVGQGALAANNNSENVAIGFQALGSNTTGIVNTAVGSFALFANTTGGHNTAVGVEALVNNTGRYNTAVGTVAFGFKTSGDQNIAIGNAAGDNLTTGSNNIDIGNIGVEAENNTIRIGTQVGVTDFNFIPHPAHTRTFIAGIRGRTTGNANAVPVVIDSAGQLGTASSSRRFKNEIKPMDEASEAILALKPVTFHYKSDNTGAPQFGLIAEEVAQVNPDLVVRDENGEIYTVRYDAVNAMLLNEFLKEHKTVQEQGAIIARQQKQIEALTAGLQKVSAQLETSRPAKQVAENSQ